ncbi:MAG: lysylphosphatidylglycerol synthase domain-containing protein [Planctomycetales bacterium]
MPSPPPSPDAPPRPRRVAWRIVKWTLFAAILAFVGWRAAALWEESRSQLAETEWRLEWLLLAALAYAAGWLPSVWFWQLLMHRLGGDLRFRDTARAYYCGHLGKYIPGKATVLVIRAALMKDRGFRPAPAALTVAYETLVMMGSGLALGLALLPLLFRDVDVRELPEWLAWSADGLRWAAARPFVPALIVGAICLVSLPAVSRIFTRIATKMTPRDIIESHGPVRIGAGVVLCGVAAFGAAWALHGLSLGCTLQALSAEPVRWEDWPMWTGAVALATSAGFAVLVAPGGVGVREGILLEVLRAQGDVEGSQALLAPIFLRIVWFLTEIVVACALYYAVRPAARPAARSPR